MPTTRQLHLRTYPTDLLGPEHFSIETIELPNPAPGEVQVHNTWMSVDPYMRGRMRENSGHMERYNLGQVLDGGAVGIVSVSNHESFKPGDQVFSTLGWREACNAPGDMLRLIDTTHLPAEAYLGIAGLTGFTAYVGITHITDVQPGDTVFVSSAAGATGATACQIAKAKGATVIGSAGGPEKTAYLREIGVDHAIDYKASPNLTEALRKAAPRGIDVYFDNVGGAHLAAALAAAKRNARFALCGTMPDKHESSLSSMREAVSKRLTLKGFIVYDHMDLLPQFMQDLPPWIGMGKLTWRQTVEEGLERAPAALAKLFTGENFGKMLLKL